MDSGLASPGGRPLRAVPGIPRVLEDTVFEFADSPNKPETVSNPLPRAKILRVSTSGRQVGTIKAAPMRLSRYLAPNRPGECQEM